MSRQQEIRKKILKLVKEFFESGYTEEFVKGVSFIKYAGRVYKEDELINLVDSSLDFWLTEGRYTKEFQRKLSSFLGVRFCLPVNSGSSANLVAISSLTSHLLKQNRLRPGDEVITTACGFPTTLNPIIQNKLVPVFIDVRLATYNIMEERIEGAINKRTKAIFIAHTLGNPANINSILKIVKKYKLWFIEDNCDSLGAKYNDKYTGGFGHISTCSFYPAHLITMGEGGAILANDALLARIIRSFRDWGRDCWCNTGEDNTCKRRWSWKLGGLPFGYDHKYIYSHIGYNLKLTDLQASIGVAQLKRIEEFIKIRNANFEFLFKNLKPFEEFLLLPQKETNSKPCWFGFAILVKPQAPFKREDIVEFLEKNLIATRMLFAGNLIRQPAYKYITRRVYGGLRNTDLITNNLFWIGVYPGIDRQRLEYIIEIFNKFFKKLR